ncbi:exonuclease RecJ [Anseongella ginsenosidimutans]|uniref:Single-stranded-DNA-specific exonuclease RecJ n=1 Tax=Anseongella ginsenosidimutans TaxID=496056 RepID=A0A4R3KX93_9SPHI|nr:single-stranded-DNA-specific exonuclease RecJ [Anseongella ginsenosidimutans]QEC50925.1 single-stranded-DNA-specific exonuclease RecJ [Anseongella ginsenosidimutans]TCS90439.1 exonuclease RecJ [Anseongella ginsenosidimutans]
MEKRWVLNQSFDEAAAHRLAQELNVSPVLGRLLQKRGISNFEGARSFFRPHLNQLHDPFLMQDMEKAVNRIEQAISGKEKILVYGDYDVDGTTAVSVVYLFFKRYYSNLDFYIPDRYKEGYGISRQGIDWAAEQDFSLIIALDCGIKSVEEVTYARSKGIDFIICDHHMPSAEIPPAVAVLDPKRPTCPYPYKELSGCGIGLKLVQAFLKKNNLPPEHAYEFLDLVTVSIASDIVPITGENRVLAYFGLLKLGSDPSPGLKALIKTAGINKNILNISDIVFGIGPRINAAGRMDDARHAVHLLTAFKPDLAIEKSELINSKNDLRREFDSNITGEALAMIEGDEQLQSRKTTVLFHPAWHKGVIGIVASRLIEKHYRPTVVLTRSGDLVTGSARSVNGFDLYSAISACSDLLEQYGGHKYAAGLTMKEANLEAFMDRFEEVVSAQITEDSLSQAIRIDEEIGLQEITPKLMRITRQFAPFGPGNMQPLFMSRAVWCAARPQLVGNNHLKFFVQQKGSHIYDSIAFGLGNFCERIRPGTPFNICYSVEENTWNGKTSIQLNIKDIKLDYDGINTT